MKTQTAVKVGRGRPSKSVKFPKGKFTVNTILNSRKGFAVRNPKAGLTFPTVKKNVDAAVASGELVVVGKKDLTGRGRKPTVYTYA